jgi:chitodextrinase
MIYRLAAAALVATASASAPDRVLYETDIRPCDETSTRCAQWGKKEKATSAHKVELTVVLKKSKDALQTLEDRFWSVMTMANI